MPMESDINLSAGDNHNFSNPMYEAMGASGDAAAAGAAAGAADKEAPGTKGLYEVPLDSASDKPPVSSEPLGIIGSSGASSKPLKSTPSSKLAILSPSAILQKTAPSLNLRAKELSPSSRDTGKDTQSLVTEDDNSEC